jgi:glucose-1-phosphate cytidylyltransferase
MAASVDEYLLGIRFRASSRKAVILAGGLGTRLAEETTIRPKPMVEIGDRPILWHIMKMYSSTTSTSSLSASGIRGYTIEE